jgi:hypothetical protein
MRRDRLVAALCSFVLSFVVSSVSSAESLRTWVYWSDAAGGRGRAEFEGVLAEDALSGRLLLGSEALVVLASVDGEGAVAGVIEDGTGAEVGTFETSIVDGELGGEFTVTGFSTGLWATSTDGPSDRIPDVTE